MKKEVVFTCITTEAGREVFVLSFWRLSFSFPSTITTRETRSSSQETEDFSTPKYSCWETSTSE